MKILANSTDLQFTTNGDFRISSTGDLEVTGTKAHRLTRQAILNRLCSAPGDWALHASMGLGLKEFVGLSNTAETGALIKSKVVAELTRDNLISGGNLDVKVFPLTVNAVAVIIMVTAPSLSPGGFMMNFSYDMRDNTLIPRRT
jgi:hypothetical protein